MEDTSGGSDSSVVKPARRAPPGAVKADKSEIQRDLPMEHVRADLVHSEHAFSSHHQAELEHLKVSCAPLPPRRPNSSASGAMLESASLSYGARSHERMLDTLFRVQRWRCARRSMRFSMCSSLCGVRDS